MSKLVNRIKCLFGYHDFEWYALKVVEDWTGIEHEDGKVEGAHYFSTCRNCRVVLNGGGK